MISLNNSSMFIGQIKQLLHDFNLPLCRIGDKNLPNNSYYITNKTIYYRYLQNNAIINKRCYDYSYNTAYNNLTANFTIDNMIYDRPTHEYLGKYLRFMRDYNQINLMSMYNCFSSSILDHDIEYFVNGTLISFNSKSTDYIVYKIPVSLVEEYSISIHNNKNIEICLYDEADFTKLNTDESKYELSKATYLKTQINGVFYYKPKEVSLTITNNLFMLLKLPRDLNTSIVVLEGKYYSKYDKLNILSVPVGNEVPLKVAAQLLSTENTYNNYLLADRLLEYLTGAVICKLSEPYDIKRLQVALDSLYNTGAINQPAIPKTTGRIYGVWDDKDLEIIKYLAIKNDLIKYDFTGYVDKDIEQYLISKTNFDTIEFNISRNTDDSVLNI